MSHDSGDTMTPLSDLRTLLSRAHGPAVERLADRTPKGIARVYLPHRTRITIPAAPDSGCAAWTQTADTVAWLLAPPTGVSVGLDLTDPGTVHALLVALACALGLDPGVGGLACAWVRCGNLWLLDSAGRVCTFGPPESRAGAHVHHLCIPAVAAEADPIKALCLAVRHMLETP